MDITQLNPILLAFVATLYTWLMTALGAGLVIFFKAPSRKILDMMLGFAGGVMVAASFWSLLSPSIEMSEKMGLIPWIPAAIGFLLGGAALKLIDTILPHLHLFEDVPEGPKTSWHRTTLLIMAVTLHNIPEGLAVGVGFGALGSGLPGASFAAAMALAIGIGIQNLPEGMAVSMPLRREGLTPWKSFWWGQLSGIVEIIAGVLGAYWTLHMRELLPYALAFAAGAMIYVVVEELIPEAQKEGSDIPTLGFMLGFTVMMILDVALG